MSDVPKIENAQLHKAFIHEVLTVGRAVNLLRRTGHRVEEQDIPGLWRINGGPEITSGQLIQIAMEASK